MKQILTETEQNLINYIFYQLDILDQWLWSYKLSVRIRLEDDQKWF